MSGAVQVLRCGVEGLSFDEHSFSCHAVELASGQVRRCWGEAAAAEGARLLAPSIGVSAALHTLPPLLHPQIIRCQQVAANAAALAEWLATFHPSTAARTTHRCCAVLDGSPVPGEQQSMVVVLPPASGAGPPVRALAVGSSTAVCPPGKWLLYLWADAGPAGGAQQPDAGGSPAAAALLPALAALADVAGLRGPAAVGAAAEPEAAAAAAAGTQGGQEAAGAAGAGETAAAAAAEGVGPAALWAAFYSHTALQLEPPGELSSGGGGRWPPNVALCPGPDASTTFVSAVDAAKRCYWQLFPPAAAGPEEAAAGEEAGTSGSGSSAPPPFPLDPGQRRRPAAAGQEDGGGAAGAAAGTAAAEDADSDDEAVAALRAALRQVTASSGGSGSTEQAAAAAPDQQLAAPEAAPAQQELSACPCPAPAHWR